MMSQNLESFMQEAVDVRFRQTSFINGQDYRDRIINILNVEKVLNEEENYLSMYSINYWIDLKELYITMRNKNYNLDLFYEYLNKFIEYNLELGLFEGKVQTMNSVSYLIGLIFSIGFANSFMSTYLFTGAKTYELISKQNVSTRNFANYILDLNKSEYPKMNFKFLQTYSLNDFIKFADDKILKKLQLDLNFYNLQGTEIKLGGVKKINSNDFNFYNQYIAYKYNILNYLVDHIIYLQKSGTQNFPTIMFQKHFLRFLIEIDRDFPLFIFNSKRIEIDNSILSIINLIFSMISYLIVTEYEFKDDDIKCLNSLIYSLLDCFEKMPSYQAIIIFIFNAYASLDYFKNSEIPNNILFNTEDNRIIRILLKKLSSKISEQEYLAIVTLLITLVDNYEQSLDLIIKEKILLVFQLNDKFNNSINITEYQENERAVNHVLWCWTIIFLRQVCLKLIEFSTDYDDGTHDHMRFHSIYNSIVEFLINHETRILHVLSDTDYIDQSGNHIHKSLAYLEELEYVTSLLNALFVQSTKWKNSSQLNLDFHHRFVNILLSKTLKLYVPNIKISNHYKFYSNVEKMMSEIYAWYGTDITSDRKDEITLGRDKIRDEHYTSFYSPMRKHVRGIENKNDKSNFENRFIDKRNILDKSQDKFYVSSHITPLSPSREFSKGIIGYTPKYSSLFFYRVDHCLNKILYNLSNIIKYATTLETSSNKYSYSNYVKENYVKGSSTYGTSQNIRVFDEQCQNLIYALYFAYHSLESMIKNFDNLEKLYNMAIIFYGNINASVNFGNLNLIYCQGISIINI